MILECRSSLESFAPKSDVGMSGSHSSVFIAIGPSRFGFKGS